MSASTRPLLPFGEVQKRLGIVTQSYAGVRPILVKRIVGSLDRTVDFNRDFRPRRPGLAARLRDLRRRYPEGDFPPINVYEVGAAFFVVDGHHRVALSRELGREFVDAEVVRLETEYELGIDVDVLTLIHTQQQRRFMEESGLAEVRPDARFEFLRPDAYSELLGHVQAFGYRESVTAGRLLGRTEIALTWYETVYQPAVAAIHDIGLDRRHTYKTDADLFLWVANKRRSLQALRADATWLDAAQAAVGESHGPLARQRLTRQQRRPLVRRAAGPGPRPG